MFFFNAQLTPDISPLVHLISHGSPINNSIIYNYLLQLQHKQKKTFFNTFFFQDLKSFGWQYAYKKHFLQQNQSNSWLFPHIKPSMDDNKILIPIHINKSHWIAESRQCVNNNIIFLYANNLNSSKIEQHVNHVLCHSNTSYDFFPPTAQ